MSPPASPGSYPGNPSLPTEVRDKILATFRHALTLFSAGNVSDCVIGCEFILKMDPRFTPAQRLREKARNHEADVDIRELEALLDPQAAASQVAAPPAPPAAAAEPRAEKPDPRRLLVEADRAFQERDFDGAVSAATRALAVAPGNKDALAMIEKAAGRKAMQPVIEASRAAAEEALADGRLQEARRVIERLRAADPKHPALPSLERRLAAPSAPPAEAAPADQASGASPRKTGEFALGGPQSEGYGATPALGDLSSEPADLDPFPLPPSDPFFVPSKAAAPEVGGPGSPGFAEHPSDADALPPSSSSRDLFLPLEEGPGSAMPSLPGPEIDEEEAQAAEREIAALIKQGDETAKRGDRQQAIEIWSRVFLIDINNSDAVTRIEQARQEIADESRLVAECLKKGRESYEAEDFDAARKFFQQAKSLDPSDPTARLYLDRIETGEAAKPEPAAPGEAAGRPAVPARTDDFPEALRATAPVAMPAAAAPRRAGLPINRRVLAVIGAFLALTLVGIFFVYNGKTTQAPPQKIASAGSLQRARDLLEKGRIDEARAELRRIGPADPDSEEARKLLANLARGKATDAGKSAPASQPGDAAGASRGGDSDPARLRAVAEQALGEKRYIDALKNFNLAAPAFRDDPAFAQEQGLASDKVTALTPAVKFYNEGEYETAIPILWRIVQEDRDNQDARSYLLRSYYNQGISQLQNGLYPKAMQAFREALALDPNDSEAARHLRFSERYQKGDLDLLGRIYVRHLNHRR